VLSYAELQSLGAELKQEPGKDGFIDKVVAFPSSDFEAHEAFSVLGQCLFLVRPDTYVGLRSEPVRKGAVTRYLKNIGGIDVPVHACPRGTSWFDPLPATILACILVAVAVNYYAVA
jgi:hypothetical protein